MKGLEQIRTWLLGLTLRQRLVLGGGVAVVVAVIYGFVAVLGKPDYKTLYSGMSAEDAQALTTRLEEKKISFQLSPDGGSVLVPAEQLDQARLEIAGNGLPRSGRLGFEIFDKPDWMGSDFAEKVNYQRALEGELERTIQTLSEVESARVHIVLPRESLFTDSEREAKASIVLKLRRLPSRESEQAITQLVAGAVDNLRPENVTLVDSTGRVLSAGQRHSGNPIDAELERTLSDKLIATLEPVVGRDHVRASVNVEYDLASTEDNRETYDPNSTVALTQQKSEESAGDRQQGGVPGTTSNVPAAKTQAPANAVTGTTQSNRSESTTFAVSRTVHHVVQPPGGIRRISAAVLLDATVSPRTSEQLQQITQLARAALDMDTHRGDTVEVQSLAFAQPPAETPVQPSLPVRVGTILQRWTELLRYGAIALLFGVVYFFVLRPVRKQLVAIMRPVSVAAQSAQLATAGGPALPAGAETEVLADAQIGSPALRRQIIERVKKEPASASRLVQSWIRQGDNPKGEAHR